MAAAPTGRSTAHMPLVLLGATVLIWGTGYWPTGVAAEHATGLMVTAIRVAPSAVLLVAAALLMRARLPRGRMLGWAVLTGILMVVVFQWGLTESIALVGPGNGAVLVNTNPLMVLVLAWIFLGERLTSLGIAGLVAGFVGVVLMVWSQLGGSYSTRDLLVGSCVALVAALAWSVGVLLLRALAQRDPEIDMVGITAVQFLVASVILVPAAFAAHGAASTDWHSGEFWASIVWIGPAAAAAVLFFFLALRSVSAAKASASLFLVPAVAVVVELARGNVPDGLVLTGMLVAVVGVALAVMPPGQLASVAPGLRRRLRGASAP